MIQPHRLGADQDRPPRAYRRLFKTEEKATLQWAVERGLLTKEQADMMWQSIHLRKVNANPFGRL